MAVNESLTASYTTVASSNTPGGSTNIGSDLDDHLRDMKKNMAVLLDDVSAVRTSAAAQSASISAIKTDLANKSSSIAALESDVSDLSLSVSAIKSAVVGIRGWHVTAGTSTLLFTDGGAGDISGKVNLHISAGTRVLSGPWAGGAGGAILESGTRSAQQSYYIWAIHRADQNSADFIASKAELFSNVVLPSGYSTGQLVWFVHTTATNTIESQEQYGNECMYTNPITATAGPLPAGGSANGNTFHNLVVTAAPARSIIDVTFYWRDVGINIGTSASVWLRDASAVYTPAASNATWTLSQNNAAVSAGAVRTRITVSPSQDIDYAAPQSTLGSTSIAVIIHGFTLLNRGNGRNT